MQIYNEVIKALGEYEKTKNTKDILIKAENKLPSLNYPFFVHAFKSTIEKKVLLEYVLQHYSKKKIEKYTSFERNALILGINLVLFSNDKQYGIVNTIVEIIKNKKPHMAPVANAILRNVIREGLSCTEGLSEDEAVRLYLSLNKSLYEVLKKQYSNDDLMLILSNHRETIDLNIIREKEELLEELYNKNISHYSINEDMISIDNTLDITKLDSFKEGRFYVQSFESAESMNIKIDEGSKVLDICASPGGKTIALIKNNPDIEVVCNDIGDNKLELLRENRDRLKLNYHITNYDALVKNPQWYNKFDLVICDVPCSATANINHIPEIRLERTREDIENLILKQREIFINALEYVKEDGFIIYSTCSILDIENIEQVKYFVDNNYVSLCNYSEGSYINGLYYSDPKEFNSEGFFSCILRKIK